MYKAMMRLYDADPGQGGGGGAPEEKQGGTAPTFDYDKLADILDGRMKATEDSVLKGYFKKAGLTGDEMTQAIEMFKKDKASKTPDVNALSQQIEEANARALNAEINLQVNTLASELGVQPSKVPYLLKMADTGKAVKDGKIDKSKLKESLEAVLKDVPELKTQTDNNVGGFKLGSDGSGNEPTQDAINAQLAQAFGVKL